MSNCSTKKPKPVQSEKCESVDGSLKIRGKKARKVKQKYPHLAKEAKKNRKKKKVYKIHNIDEIITELNSIPSPALYWDLLYKTLKEKNKSLLRNVVDELGMQECTNLLREVSLIQDNGKSMINSVGGMKAHDGSNRLKTLGGVFFYLIRTNSSLPKERKDRIFKSEKKYMKAKKNIANDLEQLLSLGQE